ncbi:MAG: GntR family transcriptional regulator [Victivallales bacterium]|nr:GntR family transcriptional regulator [Victivallales bacterium]
MIDKANKRPLYVQLADDLRGRILEGSVSTGDFIANERSLADDLKISRVTVRKGLDLLEKQQLIHKIRGKGVFAGPPCMRHAAARDEFVYDKAIGIAADYHIEKSHTAQMLNSAIEYLCENDYYPMRIGYVNARSQREVFKYFKEYLKGMIIRPSPMESEMEIQFSNISFLNSVNIRTVLIGHEIPGISCDYVRSDDKQGVEDAVQHFIDSGHRRIAYICDHRIISTRRERFNGYMHAMSNNNLEGMVFDPSVLKTGEKVLSHYERGFLLTSLLMESDMNPSAVVAENDMTALGAFTALKEHGVVLPGEVELIGIGNDIEADIYGHDLFHSLSTLDIPRHEMGRRAAELMIRRINYPVGEYLTVNLPVRLVHKGTTRS